MFIGLVRVKTVPFAKLSKPQSAKLVVIDHEFAVLYRKVRAFFSTTNAHEWT